MAACYYLLLTLMLYFWHNITGYLLRASLFRSPRDGLEQLSQALVVQDERLDSPVDEHPDFSCFVVREVVALIEHVEHELVVGVGLELWLEALSNLVAEFLLALHVALAKYLIEKLLIELSLLEALNLCNLVAEV